MILVLWFVTWVFAAQAPTVAVLDLDQATESDEYAGLGQALAGMLVADLSAVPGIQLVERERLDALMQEMRLSEGDFVDPKTAQKLGKGLGASFVVVGSYSIVRDTFLLDARVVEVESGKVAKASSASGPAQDFVTVEKTLVEDLIPGLSVTLTAGDRRKILVQAPTESFDAMAAYGLGLDAKERGDLAAAQAAFEKAIAVDPAFAEASRALTEVKGLLEAAKIERAGRFSVEFEAMNKRAVDFAPDERTRPAGFVDTMDSVVGFAVRITGQENLGADCQRAEEMKHYLDRVQWKIQEPPRRQGPGPNGRESGVFSYEVGMAMRDLGLMWLPPEAGGPYIAQTQPGRVAALWRDLSAFLTGGLQAFLEHKSSGYLASVARCAAPKDQLAEVDRVIAELDRRSLLNAKVERSAITRADELDLIWLWIHAWNIGPSEAFTRRVEKLLAAAHSTSTDMADLGQQRETAVMSQVEYAVRVAGDVARFHRGMLGMTPTEIAGTMELSAAGALRVDTAVCSQATRVQWAPKDWVKGYAESVWKEDVYLQKRRLSDGAVGVRLARDFGCVPDVKARFTEPSQVLAPAKAASAVWHENPVGGDFDSCRPLVEGVDSMTKAFGTAIPEATAVSLWQMVAGLVQQGCIPALP